MSYLTKLNEDIYSIINEYLLDKEFINLINSSKKIKYECEKIYLLFEIGRVKKLKNKMYNDNDIQLSGECNEIEDYEYRYCEEEPILYEFRNFKVNNNFNNKKFILNIIKLTNIHALKYFKDILTIDLNDKDDIIFIKALININSICLYNLPLEIVKNYEIVLLISNKYGGILEYCSHDFRSNKELVKSCYKNHITCLEYASDKLLDNEEFMFEAILFNYDSFRYLSKRLLNDEIFISKIIEENPKSINKIVYWCSDEILNLNKFRNISDYDKSMRLYSEKYIVHETVPFNIKIRNKFKKNLIEKKYKYNHQFYYDEESIFEPERLFYNYY